VVDSVDKKSTRRFSRGGPIIAPAADGCKRMLGRGLCQIVCESVTRADRDGQPVDVAGQSLDPGCQRFVLAGEPLGRRSAGPDGRSLAQLAMSVRLRGVSVPFWPCPQLWAGCQWDAIVRAQQIWFNRFRQEYNHERPHEALDQETPGSVNEPSPRTLSPTLPPMEYPGPRVALSGEGRPGRPPSPWHGVV